MVDVVAAFLYCQYNDRFMKLSFGYSVTFGLQDILIVWICLEINFVRSLSSKDATVVIHTSWKAWHLVIKLCPGK